MHFWIVVGVIVCIFAVLCFASGGTLLDFIAMDGIFDIIGELLSGW